MSIMLWDVGLVHSTIKSLENKNNMRFISILLISFHTFVYCAIPTTAIEFYLTITSLIIQIINLTINRSRQISTS